MAKITIDDLIGFVNDWDEDMISLYGGVDKIITIIGKKGRLTDIDLRNSNLDDEINKIYWSLINSEDPEIKKYGYDSIKEIDLSSDLIQKDSKWYWILDDSSELSVFFCDDGRYDNSQQYAETILRGDDWEPFDVWRDANIYRDVVDDLNEENLTYLRNKIIEELSGGSLEIETSLLSDLCEDDENCVGDNPRITITPEIINHIIRDEETLNYLFKEHLDDIDSMLRSLYDNSYNQAYTDECNSEVWSRIADHLGEVKGEWVSRPHPHKENKIIQKYHIDVTEFSDYVIYKFLETNKTSSYGQDQISYHGGLHSLIKQLIYEDVLDCSRLRLDDSPDYRLVKKAINDNFGDYL